MAAGLGRAEHLPLRATPRQKEALHPRHVPVPVGLGASRRAPRGVHGDRHRRALLADARPSTSCTPWGGTRSASPPSSTPSPPTRTRATRPRRTSPRSSASSRALGLQLRLVARDRHDRPRLRAAGRSGSSSSSSRRASPTRRRSRSTGARRSAPCSPTRRSSTARASGEGTRSSASRCGSGCSRSRRTPIASTRTSRVSTGPSRRRPSSTSGSAAAKAPRSTSPSSARGASIRVFTTRADTLPGVTYVVLAPEHPLVADARHARARGGGARLRRGRPEQERPRSRRGQDEDRRTPRRDGGEPDHGREGPDLGRRLRHRARTGRARSWPCPRTTSAITRSRARTGCPSSQVIAPATGGGELDVQEAAFTDDGVARYGAHPGRRAGRNPERGGARARHRLAREGRKGSDARSPTSCATGSSRASATGASRSRSTSPSTSDGDPRAPGARVTIHYDQPIAVADEELPLRLPDLDDFRPGDDPAGPLARAVDWRFFQKDGRWFARETNTMPQWAGSCWYYLRFLDPHDDARGVEPRGLRRLDAGRPLRRRRRARRLAPALRALLAQGALRPRAW